MRTYRVTLRSSAVGTLEHHPLAGSYQQAAGRAESWANQHPEHGHYGPWTAENTEVSA